MGADPGGPQAVVTGVTGALADARASVHHMELDLADPGAPAQLINAAADTLGHVDILVCSHARSGGNGPLGALDAAMLDVHWAVNTRSAILLAQAFADQHDGRPGGRIIFMTSGQDLGPGVDNGTAIGVKEPYGASLTPMAVPMSLTPRVFPEFARTEGSSG